MSVARWDDLKEKIRVVIWELGLIGAAISYKDLCLRLEGVPLYHRSSTLTGLLNEIARDERDKGAPCWVTAIVVLSGRQYSGAGFFKMVLENGRVWTGKTAFCKEQRRHAKLWIRKYPKSLAAAA